VTTTTSHFALDAPMALAPPTGDPLPVHAVDLALEREDGVLVEVRFTFTISAEAYARVIKDSLFHLAEESRGPLAGKFTADGDVQVEARLDRPHIPGVALLGEDILQTGPAFGALAAGSPLLETESWYALSVTREVLRDAEGGSLREGYSTLHASPERDLRLPMLAIAEAAFEERGIEWQETTDDEVIRADVVGENGFWAVFAVAREREGRCTIYAQAPWNTPEERRGEMAECITRVNFGLPLGNFEMDYSDGEVRFKTSLGVADERLTTALFEGLFEPNMATMDHYLPALESVRDGRASAVDAVRAVEEGS
jgi:hypothetical protein